MSPDGYSLEVTRHLGLVVVGLALSGALALPASSVDRNLKAASAYVHKHCPGAGVPSTSMWTRGWTFNAVFGDCGGGDGRDQHIWFFIGGRFLTLDSANSSREVVGVWRDDKTMAFLYVLYRSRDAMCCPTGGGSIVRFRWTGKRLIRLDRLPPRLSGSLTIGR
jgi:hypothetical protein